MHFYRTDDLVESRCVGGSAGGREPPVRPGGGSAAGGRGSGGERSRSARGVDRRKGVRRALDQAGVAALADLERRGTSESGATAPARRRWAICWVGNGWRQAAPRRRRAGPAPRRARRHTVAAAVARHRRRLRGRARRVCGTSRSWPGCSVRTRRAGWIRSSGRAPRRSWPPGSPTAHPPNCRARGEQLLEALDADGPEPDDRPEPSVNELHLQRNRRVVGAGWWAGSTTRRCSTRSPPSLDAQAAPRTAEDDRTPAQRQAEALADACGWVLDHADTAALSSCGGRRPQLSVVVGLADLETPRPRRRAWISAARSARRRCGCWRCDAAVVPVVLGGAGQPLDVGRATRTIPDGLRRAVTVRDGGCARCGRPPSWCEVHHTSRGSTAGRPI